MISVIFAIIVVIIFLALSILLWGVAVEFSDIPRLKRFKDTLLSRFEETKDFWMGKIAAIMEKALEYKARKRGRKKNSWKFFRDRLKKPGIDDSETYKKVPFFPGTLLLFFFWSSVFFAWLSYEFYSLTSFYVIFIVCTTCALFAFIFNSFNKVDYMVLKYLKEEIKDLPKRIKDLFKEAFDSLSWTFVATILYILLIEKPDFKQIDLTILITRVGIHFIRLFAIIYCIKIVIYSARKIGGSKTAETLGGVSASMMLAAGYYESLLPDFWGTVVFWVYYSLGFTASFFTIRFNVKKLTFTKGTISKKKFLTLFFKFVAIVMFTSIILELLFGFIVLGTYPGSSDISRACSKNLGDAIENFFKSTEVFQEFKRQTKKGFEKADFASISATFYRNPYIQKSIKSFAALKENAMKAREFTWHRYNLFGLYNWLGDSMLSVFNYMYIELPGFFQCIQYHSKEVNEFTEIFKNKEGDLKALEVTLSAKQYLTHRQTMEKILVKARRCNNLYETLKPSWMWRMIPNIGSFHKFMLELEARIWIFLNYVNLKRVYKDEYFVVKRSKVIRHGSSIDHYKLKKKYGDILVFPFDQKIMIYSGIGDLH
ncbi:MAG: hypothetical protein JSV88_31465 [Candidatus Aminicenantes bacterium]|nr:MAG: hypothetical protein JSV88_31465 [Candidatus Aminicenantes bacterium]